MGSVEASSSLLYFSLSLLGERYHVLVMYKKLLTGEAEALGLVRKVPSFHINGNTEEGEEGDVIV